MNEKKDIFSRQAIKDRLMQSAATSWGFEKYEIEQFDPLVELMMGALAKEMEKTSLYFEKRYGDVLQNTISRLIPEFNTTTRPAFTVIQLRAPNGHTTLTPENATFEKDFKLNGEDINISFSPLSVTELTPYYVRYLGYGQKVYECKDLEKNPIINYSGNSHSFIVGLDVSAFDPMYRNINLYFDWPNNPVSDSYLKFLQNSSLNHAELIESSLLNERNRSGDKYEGEKNESDTDFFMQPNLSDYLSSFRSRLISLRIPLDSISLTGKFPGDINHENQKLLDKIHENGNILWIEFLLPEHPNTEKMLENMYCQTNCVPVINYRTLKNSLKIKAPFKIVKLADQGQFVRIKRIENIDGKKYTAKEALTKDTEKMIAGTYLIHRKIARMGQNDAKTEITNMIDLIKEERNAFAAQEPDWLVSELNDLKIQITKIERKLDHKEDLKSSDIYLEFENKVDEDILYIEYVVCQGKIANGICVGEWLDVNSSELNTEKALVLTNSFGGHDVTSDKSKLNLLAGIIHGSDKIVTQSDLAVYIKNVLHEYEVKSINIYKDIIINENSKTGYNHVVIAETALGKNMKQAEMDSLSEMIQHWVNKKSVFGLEIKIKILPYV